MKALINANREVINFLPSKIDEVGHPVSDIVVVSGYNFDTDIYGDGTTINDKDYLLQKRYFVDISGVVQRKSDADCFQWDCSDNSAGSFFLLREG